MNFPERILLNGSNLWYLGEGMLGPLFAVFAERVGGDILDIAWAWATYLIVTGVLTIVFGKLSDHSLHKDKLMVAGYALNALCTFSYLLVDTPMQLLIVQLGLGVASAMATPTWNALYAKRMSRKKDGFLWGLADGQAQIITGFSMIAGGIIVSYGSFTHLFIIMGCVQVAATAYQARILGIR